MKQIALAFVLAYAFTTGMAVVTVVAHTDQAMPDSAAADVVYPLASVSRIEAVFPMLETLPNSVVTVTGTQNST
jgi:hypothetical protein